MVLYITSILRLYCVTPKSSLSLGQSFLKYPLQASDDLDWIWSLTYFTTCVISSVPCMGYRHLPLSTSHDHPCNFFFIVHTYAVFANICFPFHLLSLCVIRVYVNQSPSLYCSLKSQWLLTCPSPSSLSSDGNSAMIAFVINILTSFGGLWMKIQVYSDISNQWELYIT